MADRDSLRLKTHPLRYAVSESPSSSRAPVHWGPSRSTPQKLDAQNPRISRYWFHFRVSRWPPFGATDPEGI
jgi:hypothetical protein